MVAINVDTLVLLVVLGLSHVWMGIHIIRHWKLVGDQLKIRMSKNVALFPTMTYPFTENIFSDKVNAFAERKTALKLVSYHNIDDGMVCLLSHSSYLNKVGLMPISLLTLLFTIVTHVICVLFTTFLDVPSMFNTINSVIMACMVSYNIYSDRMIRKNLFGTTDALTNYEINNATHVFLLSEES